MVGVECIVSGVQPASWSLTHQHSHTHGAGGALGAEVDEEGEIVRVNPLLILPSACTHTRTQAHTHTCTHTCTHTQSNTYAHTHHVFQH